MYYFYILLFLIINVWLLNKITSSFREILLNNKVDKSHPVIFNVLTKEYKKNRVKKTGFRLIVEQIQTLLK